MKIIDLLNNEREVVAVVPTMDITLPRVIKLKDDLDRNGVDMIAVEDSGPAFRFAKSMNAGIKEALSKESVKYILLSNDDVYAITGFSNMLNAIKHTKYDYAHPYINGVRPSAVATRSTIKTITNFAIRKQAPFFAWDKIRMARNVSGIKHPMFMVPSVLHLGGEIISVQPFGLLKKEILEMCRFDENFQNSMEDDDLMCQINFHGYRGITNENWNIRHSVGASFRTINKHDRMGSSYGGEEQFKGNLRYFCRKYENGWK